MTNHGGRERTLAREERCRRRSTRFGQRSQVTTACRFEGSSATSMNPDATAWPGTQTELGVPKLIRWLRSSASADLGSFACGRKAVALVTRWPWHRETCSSWAEPRNITGSTQCPKPRLPLLGSASRCELRVGGGGNRTTNRSELCGRATMKPLRSSGGYLRANSWESSIYTSVIDLAALGVCINLRTEKHSLHQEMQPLQHDDDRG